MINATVIKLMDGKSTFDKMRYFQLTIMFSVDCILCLNDLSIHIDGRSTHSCTNLFFKFSLLQILFTVMGYICLSLYSLVTLS